MVDDLGITRTQNDHWATSIVASSTLWRSAPNKGLSTNTGAVTMAHRIESDMAPWRPSDQPCESQQLTNIWPAVNNGYWLIIGDNNQPAYREYASDRWLSISTIQQRGRWTSQHGTSHLWNVHQSIASSVVSFWITSIHVHVFKAPSGTWMNKTSCHTWFSEPLATMVDHYKPLSTV